MATDRESRFNLIIGAEDKFTGPFQKFNHVVNESSGPLNRLNDRIKTLGRESGLTGIVSGIKGMGGAAKDVFGELTALAGKATVVGELIGGGLFALAKSSASASREIIDNAQKAGLSAQAWQQWAFAADRSELSGQELINTLTRLGKSAFEASRGGQAQATAFRRAGIEIKNAQGKIKPAEQLLSEVADRVNSLQNPYARRALVSTLFGDEGTRLLPFLAKGSAGLADLRKEAERLGFVLDDETLASGAVFDRQLKDMGSRASALGRTLGNAVIPPLSNTFNVVAKLVDENQELINSTLTSWLGNLSDLLPQTEAELKNTLSSVENFGKGIDEGIKLIGGMENAAIALGLVLAGPLMSSVVNLGMAVGTLSKAILTSPLGLLLAAGTLSFLAGQKIMDTGLTSGQVINQKLEDSGGADGLWSSATGDLIYNEHLAQQEQAMRGVDPAAPRPEPTGFARQYADMPDLTGPTANNLPVNDPWSTALENIQRQQRQIALRQPAPYGQISADSAFGPPMAFNQPITRTERHEEQVTVRLELPPGLEAVINGARVGGNSATFIATPGNNGLQNAD